MSRMKTGWEKNEVDTYLCKRNQLEQSQENVVRWILKVNNPGPNITVIRKWTEILSV